MNSGNNEGLESVGQYPRTVYIAGAARSGSTLLGEVLGAQPGVLNVGEISLFWRDADRRNTCACGVAIPDCALWSVALEEVSSRHGVSRCDFSQLARTRARLARTTHPRELLRLRRSRRQDWPDDVRLLIDATRTLVAAAARVAGAEVVVDASKTLPSLLFLDLCGSPSDVVHLIRRPEAVVSSTLRSRAIPRGNPESIPPGGSLMTGVGRWMWANMCSVMASKSSTVASCRRLHYEHFSDDPEGTIRSLCDDLSIEFDPHVVEGHVVGLTKKSHAAVGNPSRGAREIAIAQDDRWRRDLDPQQRILITILTSPLRLLLR